MYMYQKSDMGTVFNIDIFETAKNSTQELLKIPRSVFENLAPIFFNLKKRLKYSFFRFMP